MTDSHRDIAHPGVISVPVAAVERHDHVGSEDGDDLGCAARHLGEGNPGDRAGWRRISHPGIEEVEQKEVGDAQRGCRLT